MRIIREHKVSKKHKPLVLENLKLAKQYVEQGKLSKEDLEQLLKLDPTSTKKFMGWMAKVYMTEKPSLDELGNAIEQYNTFLEKGKAITKDINAFKTFKDLKNELQELNQSGAGKSVKDLENDYETIVSNEDILICSPHTHEASRKLGLSKFAFRDCEGGKKDSAWCTTYKAPDHFEDYYYNLGLTFYYIRVYSSDMLQKIFKALGEYPKYQVVALTVDEGGSIEGWDGEDERMDDKQLKKYLNIIEFK